MTCHPGCQKESAQAENRLEDRGYASTSRRRETVTVAMCDNFAKNPASSFRHQRTGDAFEERWSCREKRGDAEQLWKRTNTHGVIAQLDTSIPGSRRHDDALGGTGKQQI